MSTVPPARLSGVAPLPVLAVLASLCCQNAGAAFAKSLFQTVGPEGMTALRVGIAALLLTVVMRPWRVRPNRRQAWSLLAYGAALGLMNLTIYGAFARIPIGIAIAIEVTGPLTVVLLGSRRPRDFLWLGLAVAGLLLLLPPDGLSAPLDPVGVALAIGAGVCWACYILFGSQVAVLPRSSAVAGGMLVAAVVTVPIGLAEAGSGLLRPGILLAGLAVAVLSSALPYSLEMLALGRMPRRVFGMLVSSAPAIGGLAGFLLLGERLTLLQAAAILCIMLASGASAASTWPRRSAPKDHKSA